MKKRALRFAFTVGAVAAALAACDRGDRIPLPQSDTTPSTASSESQRTPGALSSGTTAPGTSAVGATESSTQAASDSPSGMTGGSLVLGGSTTGDADALGVAIANNPPGAIGAAATAALADADQQFLSRAAEGSQFELEVAKLAAEKASDPAVRAFAQMLVDDHGAANNTLRQIATGHNLALPAAPPDEKKRELEQLAKLTGPDFDRQFIRMVGIQDHHHDIAEFEKAAQVAQAPDVKGFAQNTLPALKKHLEAARKLPGAGSAKG